MGHPDRKSPQPRRQRPLADEGRGFLPKAGNYRSLLSYRKAEILFDFTVRFTQEFLPRGDRTIDQMVQAARSGKQNIAEASRAAVTSAENELKLTNVARASLEELLLDYEDYLRTRGHPQWDKTSREALYARRLGRRGEEGFATYAPFFRNRPPAILANIALCLVNQANYLLDRQIERLENDFVEKGGLRERMTRVRRAQRDRSHGQKRTHGADGRRR